MTNKSVGKSTAGRGLTPKQEKFCQLYVELGNATEAYRQSYDVSDRSSSNNRVSAAKLLASDAIEERIAELRAEHRERHNLTVNDLLDELEEARKAALSAETVQSSAAISATMGKAKLLGLDKQIIDLRSGDKPLPTSINVSFGDERT